MYQCSLIITLFLLLSGCADTDQPITKEAAMQTINGEVFYREKKLLPPGAELTVSLEDVSKMDVASTLIAVHKQSLEGAPPYAFKLEYDPSMIKPKMRYSVRAVIKLDSRLLMTSTDSLDPFREPENELKIQLKMVGSKSAVQDKQKPDTGLAVVSHNPLASLDNTYWQLKSLNEQPVAMAEGQARESFLQLKADDSTVKGFAGCNTFQGGYVMTGNNLTFGPLMTTRKACRGAMDVESQFLSLLGVTGYYSIHKNTLTLLNNDKKPIARFEAQYFN